MLSSLKMAVNACCWMWRSCTPTPLVCAAGGGLLGGKIGIGHQPMQILRKLTFCMLVKVAQDGAPYPVRLYAAALPSPQRVEGSIKQTGCSLWLTSSYPLLRLHNAAPDILSLAGKPSDHIAWYPAWTYTV